MLQRLDWLDKTAGPHVPADLNDSANCQAAGALRHLVENSKDGAATRSLMAEPGLGPRLAKWLDPRVASLDTRTAGLCFFGPLFMSCLNIGLKKHAWKLIQHPGVPEGLAQVCMYVYAGLGFGVCG